MNFIAKAILAVVLTLIGLAGLYFKIEYSGWVLFAAVVASLNLS